MCSIVRRRTSPITYLVSPADPGSERSRVTRRVDIKNTLWCIRPQHRMELPPGCCRPDFIPSGLAFPVRPIGLPLIEDGLVGRDGIKNVSRDLCASGLK